MGGKWHYSCCWVRCCWEKKALLTDEYDKDVYSESEMFFLPLVTFFHAHFFSGQFFPDFRNQSPNFLDRVQQNRISLTDKSGLMAIISVVKSWLKANCEYSVILRNNDWNFFLSPKWMPFLGWYFGIETFFHTIFKPGNLTTFFSSFCWNIIFIIYSN